MSIYFIIALVWKIAQPHTFTWADFRNYLKRAKEYNAREDMKEV